jgi:hydroxymethylbilane synthase
MALSGMKRAALFDPEWMSPLEPDEMLPAPGQGALALQCRKNDAPTRAILRLLHHPPTELCVNAERELVRLLGGDCHSPIAAFARVEEDQVTLRAAVGARDGRPPVVSAEANGPSAEVEAIVGWVYQRLVEQHVEALLRG